MNNPSKPVIGYVLKGYPRISETFIANEILFLERLGFTIRLFSMRHPRENFTHASVKQIKARVDYLPTDLAPNIFRLLAANLQLAIKKPRRFFKTASLALTRYRRTRKTATIKHLLQAGYMTNSFLLQEPAIRHLHGHFAHSPTSVTMFASLLSGLPFSFTAHAKDIYTSNPKQLKEKIDNANFVVTCTQHNAQYLNSIAPDSETPVHCIYHGIDLELFQHQQEKIQPHPPYRLFTVARLTEKKGLPTIYQALSLLKKRGLPFKHTLIGDGDDREKLQNLIQNLDLSDQCCWLGTQTHDEVLKQFKQSDLFILGCEIAKNGDRDGIPNVLVESLAMGVPALSTQVSAIPEVLLHEKTGLTVPPSDPQAMAQAIVTLLENSALRKTVIQEGKLWVEKQFDSKKWVKHLADVFADQPHIPIRNYLEKN